MEKVQQIHKFKWIDQKVGVREFRDSYNTNLSFTQNDQTPNEQIEKIKSLKKGFEDPEVEYLDPDSRLQLAMKLKTVRIFEDKLTKRKANPRLREQQRVHSKATAYPLYKKNPSKAATGETMSVTTPEVVLFVQICRPVQKRPYFRRPARTKHRALHADQEYMVLGCQVLTELRDKIECVSDNQIPGEFSTNPDRVQDSPSCKDLYKSGFFYINGTFYNDMRQSKNEDYSEPIIKWAQGKSEFSSFSKSLMEEAKFIDLEIQLGYPYLYMHQGNCEHLIIFSDMCMFNDHPNNKNLYPIRTAVKHRTKKNCMVCCVQIATWLVRNNSRLNQTSYLFCKECFLSFNYVDGEKVGKFEAYHYPSQAALT